MISSLTARSQLVADLTLHYCTVRIVSKDSTLRSINTPLDGFAPDFGIDSIKRNGEKWTVFLSKGSSAQSLNLYSVVYDKDFKLGKLLLEDPQPGSYSVDMDPVQGAISVLVPFADNRINMISYVVDSSHFKFPKFEQRSEKTKQKTRHCQK